MKKMKKVYERPALTAAGGFAKETGLGLTGRREVLVLRRRL